MRLKNKNLFYIFILLSHLSFSQTIINYNDYLQSLLKYNPIARKSNNIGEFGKLMYKASRGNYDPTLNASFGIFGIMDSSDKP